MKTRNNLKQNWRLPNIVFKIFLFCILILFAQYTYLSLSSTIYGIYMDEFAANRNTVEQTLFASRGNIFDTDGNVLTHVVNSYTVIAYLSETRTGSSPQPMHVVDKQATAEALSPLLNMEVNYLIELLSKEVYQVELGPGGRGITELKKEEIQALNLPGISFIETHKRYYPNGDFASYIIGYAKKNESTDGSTEEIVGEMGIESQFNDILKGTDGFTIYQRDRFGYKIPDTKETTELAEDGDDIYLTIDSAIQRFAEAAIKEATNTYDPEWMVVTVMDAKTGDILASATSPSFDPNVRNIESYENPLISLVYEPGSTMKIYTYICAMEKGTYQGDETFLSGNIVIGDATVNDWNNGKGWGTVTFDKGFEYSSNVGVSYIMQRFLTKEELRDCFKSYGFGTKTGIELSGELSGFMSFNYPIEVANAAFGQGVLTTTALQQLQALTIIANDGKMLIPHIVKQIVNSKTNEIIYDREVEESEPLVSQATVDKMKELMYNVIHGTDEGTTGRSYQIGGFDVIGKTGTSQIFSNTTGQYLAGENDYIFSFSGMFPKDEPEVIVYIAMKKPSYGKATAVSTVSKSLMTSIAKYKGLFQEEQNTSEEVSYTLASYTNKQTGTVKNTLEDYHIDVVVLGKGDKIIDQYPKSGTTVLSHEKVILMTNDATIKMPNLTGWSRKEAIQLLTLLDLSYQINEYGYVKEQSIVAGTIITAGDEITLTLAEKFQTS